MPKKIKKEEPVVKPKLTPGEIDQIKRAALFVPCETKEHLKRWVKIFLGIDVPDTIVCDDDSQNPSNSSMMDALWELYSKAKAGNDPDYQQILVYSCRDGGKTLLASILELLCMFHLDREVCHLASIEAQAKKSQEYVEGYFKKPILRDYLTSKNKRTIEMTRYVNSLDGSIISPIVYDSLSREDQNLFEEKKQAIKILVCTMNSVNGEHPNMLVADELDLADPKPVEEAKLTATTKQGKLPIILLTSTRKSATGPVQGEIDKAEETKLVIRHWNIIDVTEPCPPERHKPDEPKQIIYSSDEELKAINEEAYLKLSDKEKESYEKFEAYAGCASCKLFPACKGRLATKQTGKSEMLKPIDHVIGLFNKVTIDTAKAQLLCWKPSSEGLVYPSFNQERHILTANQMAEMITGEEFHQELTKDDLVRVFRDHDAKFFCGMDHGFTHNFAVVTAALVGHVLYVFDVISVANLELMEKIELCKSRLSYLSPTIYPDNAYPADNKTFKRHGFKMVHFKKEVAGGIQAVRERLNPGFRKPPHIYFLKGDAEIALLTKDMSRYSFKTDAQGELTDEPKPENDDRLDALRYLCQNVPVSKTKVLAEFTNGGQTEKEKPTWEDPNKDWLKKKINELIQDSLDDEPSVHGKKGGMNFII